MPFEFSTFAATKISTATGAPADQYDTQGRALFHDGINSPDVKLYFGGEIVLDAQGNPVLHTSSADPIYDLLNSSRLFQINSLGGVITLSMASAQNPWGAAGSLDLEAGVPVRVTLFDTKRSVTLLPTEFTVDAATNVVTLNPGAATRALFPGQVQAQVIHLKPLVDVLGNIRYHDIGDPVRYFRYEPVLQRAGDPVRYLGGEPFYEEPRWQQFSAANVGSATTLNLAGTSVGANDAVSVFLRNGSAARQLALGEYQASGGTVSFAGLSDATIAWIGGAPVAVEIFVAARVLNSNGTEFLHTAGQQVLHERRELVLDQNGNLTFITPIAITDTFGGLNDVDASFDLNLSYKPVAGVITVTRPGEQSPLVAGSMKELGAI